MQSKFAIAKAAGTRLLVIGPVQSCPAEGRGVSSSGLPTTRKVAKPVNTSAFLGTDPGKLPASRLRTRYFRSARYHFSMSEIACYQQLPQRHLHHGVLRVASFNCM